VRDAAAIAEQLHAHEVLEHQLADQLIAAQ